MRILGIILFITIILVLKGYGQCSVKVQFITETGEAISGVNVLDDDAKLICTSGISGFAYLEIEVNETIYFSHINFLESKKFVRCDEKIYTEVLYAKSFPLEETTVLSEKLPEVVFKDDRYNVADYAFNNDCLFILRYTKEKRFKSSYDSDRTLFSECQVLKLDSDLNEIAASRFISQGVRFRNALQNELLIETNEGLYAIIENGDFLDLVEYSQKVDISNVDYIQTTYKGEMVSILNDFDQTFPEFSYYTFTEKTGLNPIYTISDKELMHVFRAQWRNLNPRDKLEAYRTELSSGIDKEIISGYMLGFHKSILFEPIYAPAHIVDSNLLVFNHQENEIAIIHISNHEKRSVPIKYHSSKGADNWEKKIHFDESLKNAYAQFKSGRHKVLKQVDLASGETSNEYLLTFQYPEKITVLNGWAYYIYRPFASSQKKYLYKEKLSDIVR